jgi:hypothetical protein
LAASPAGRLFLLVVGGAAAGGGEEGGATPPVSSVCDNGDELGLARVSEVGAALAVVVVMVVTVAASSQGGGESETGDDDDCGSVSITTTSWTCGWGSGTAGSAAVQHSGELGQDVRGEIGGVGGMGGRSAGVSFRTCARGVILG